jgi:CBS domain-containing protein
MRLRRNLVNRNGATSVGEIMDPCSTIYPDEPLSQAVIKMDAAQVRQLSVINRVDGHGIVGIVTMTDIVRVQAGAIADSEQSVLTSS